MRSARALWGFLIFVFIGAALVSPWIYHACVAFGLTGIPFRRVVDRCLIVLAVVALWPFVKALGVRSRKELGLKNYPTLGRDLATGFAIGIALLVIAAAFSMAAGASHWVPRNGWPKQIGSAIATAVAVALLEEILFRGAIYTGLTRIWGALAGLWVSSGLYAILHFFARPENPAVIDWKAGFVVLGRMLQGFSDFQQVVPGFFSLVLLGVILVLALRRTGALFMSMGIHAGVVFGVKLFGFGADTSPNANTWFCGTEKLVDGWFCFILLAITTVYFAKVKSRTT
ncbi:MAG TPA: type II CAAX endopeptidase family protein [Verrucomicrobiae bacterium]